MTFGSDWENFKVCTHFSYLVTRLFLLTTPHQVFATVHFWDRTLIDTDDTCTALRMQCR
jgi:hypothetical protein